jgi:hypothetical protein
LTNFTSAPLGHRLIDPSQGCTTWLLLAQTRGLLCPDGSYCGIRWLQFGVYLKATLRCLKGAWGAAWGEPLLSTWEALGLPSTANGKKTALKGKWTAHFHPSTWHQLLCILGDSQGLGGGWGGAGAPSCSYLPFLHQVPGALILGHLKVTVLWRPRCPLRSRGFFLMVTHTNPQVHSSSEHLQVPKSPFGEHPTPLARDPGPCSQGCWREGQCSSAQCQGRATQMTCPWFAVRRESEVRQKVKGGWATRASEQPWL